MEVAINVSSIPSPQVPRKHPSEPGRPREASTAGDELALTAIFATAWRYKWILVAGFALGAVIAHFFISAAIPLYRADSLIVLEARKPEVLQFDALASALTTTPSGIQTEIDVLRSAALAERVIDHLGLMNDPEFNSSILPNESPPFWKALLSSIFPKSDPTNVKDIEYQKTQVISSFHDSLSIGNLNDSYSIRVSFVSPQPEKAAQIANTIVEQYLTSQLEAKLQAMQRANSWLSSRVTDLRIQVESSGMALQSYKERQDLIEARGQTVSNQQLSELNTQLVLARTELAELSAKYSRVRELIGSGQMGSAPEVLDSPLVQRLKEQEVELLRRQSELSLKYGERHPTLVNLNGELRELRNKMQLEIQSIAQSLESQVEVARTRVNTLQKNVRELQTKVGALAVAEVKLDELQREADADRALFEDFLSRFKETAYQQDVQQPDARIVSKARSPLVPYYPRVKLTYAAGGITGILLGLILVMFIEQFDNRIRSAEQLESVTGVPTLGMIPQVFRLRRSSRAYEVMMSEPNSAYSEAVQSILAAVQFSGERSPRSILVTSALPHEGKTTVAISLAIAYARSGFTTLLVDADLRRPAATKLLGKANQAGLVDCLQGRSDLNTVLHTGPSELTILPAGLLHAENRQVAALQTRLASSYRMKEMLDRLSERFDVLIIDSPPLIAVADAAFLASFTEASVLVAKWASSTRQSVRLAVDQLRRSGGLIAGTVLSSVNLRKHRSYGYHDFGHYYHSIRNYHKV